MSARCSLLALAWVVVLPACAREEPRDVRQPDAVPAVPVQELPAGPVVIPEEELPADVVGEEQELEVVELDPELFAEPPVLFPPSGPVPELEPTEWSQLDLEEQELAQGEPPPAPLVDLPPILPADTGEEPAALLEPIGPGAAPPSLPPPAAPPLPPPPLHEPPPPIAPGTRAPLAPTVAPERFEYTPLGPPAPFCDPGPPPPEPLRGSAAPSAPPDRGAGAEPGGDGAGRARGLRALALGAFLAVTAGGVGATLGGALAGRVSSRRA